jgi:photosystem II stability/assembly factor-like uncharacterized protein
MKQILRCFYLLLTLLIMFIEVVFAQSGWVRQYPPPQTQNISLLSVSFADANNGFITGVFGTILHTANGGTDWQSQLSGTIHALRGVSAIDANAATAVGDSGIILRTTNGGEIWELQPSGTACSLRAVSFTDANTGTVVGDSGTILRTTNGGTIWISQTSGTMNNLRGVSFINSNIGTAVGDSGTILRTTSGGITWTSQLIQHTDPKTYKLYGVSFTDADTGTAVGYTSFVDNISPSIGPGGIILRTTDGGITWHSEATPYVSTIFSGCPLFGVSFTDANTGTAVGPDTIGFAGVIWRITPDSESWINQSFGNAGFYGVCFTDANTGTVVGENGTIFHTTTGGVTSVKDNPIQLPEQFALEQNYPNPFNPSTVINYKLATSCFVSMKVYDILGREIKTLINEHKNVGDYSITFNANNLPSGVYFYRIQASPTNSGQAENYYATKKFLLLK